MEAGTILLDKVTGDLAVLVADWGDRYLVSGLASLKPDATLIERAQRTLPAADFEVAK
jgi:hypothetical protein